MRRLLKIGLRAGIVILLAVIVIWAVTWIELNRTEEAQNAVLSAYLTDRILHDGHDWGSGRDILVVIQRESQRPGIWRQLWPFRDKRMNFAESSIATRVSFALANGFRTNLNPALRLPRGVSYVIAGRKELEDSQSGNFEARFPNSRCSRAI